MPKAKRLRRSFTGAIWKAWEHVAKDATDPSNYVSGKDADHYNLYAEDFDLLKKMNMNAFRFSVEWSRIEPTEGAWNVEAITHYKHYVLELKQRNIEPVLTLFHFTLPVWFVEKGGFEKRANVKYFVRFADKIFARTWEQCSFYVLTVNEPEVYAFEGF